MQQRKRPRAASLVSLCMGILAWIVFIASLQLYSLWWTDKGERLPTLTVEPWQVSAVIVLSVLVPGLLAIVACACGIAAIRNRRSLAHSHIAFAAIGAVLGGLFVLGVLAMLLFLVAMP